MVWPHAAASRPVDSWSTDGAIGYPPPSGFDPGTATWSEFVRAGFHQLPRSLEAQVLPAYRRALHYYPPCFIQEPRISATVVDSSNWAGPMDTPSGSNDQEVLTYWTVPKLPDACQSLNEQYVSSSWAGLDEGYASSDELFQAGTEQDLTPIVGRNGCVGVTLDYYPWWEVYPRYSQQGLSWGVSADDLMYTDIYLNGSKMEFFLEDTTTGDYSSFGESSAGYNGESAELILERTETSICTEPPLAPDSTTAFQDAEVAINGTYKGPGEWVYVDWDMYNTLNSSGTGVPPLLAEYGGFSNDGENVTNTWKASGECE